MSGLKIIEEQAFVSMIGFISQSWLTQERCFEEMQGRGEASERRREGIIRYGKKSIDGRW